MRVVPNVLVLGDYPIGYKNGIGETLANLFLGYPSGALFTAYPAHLGLEVHGDIGALPYRAPVKSGWIPRRLRILGHVWLKLEQHRAKEQLVRSVLRWVGEFGITTILTFPVSPWVLAAAVRLRRLRPDLRFVFYVMDDWEGHHTCFGLPFTRRRRRHLEEMIRTADARFACSHRMAEDYRQRFGVGWKVLHKGVESTDVQTRATNPAEFRSILYAGAVNVFRLDAMVGFAEGLRRFISTTGRQVTLEILGTIEDAASRASLERFDFIKVSPWVSHHDCQGRLKGADLLYLPLSFSARLSRIAELAMPTKLSEYLASGTPAIFHVPPQSEVMRLTSRAGLPLRLGSPEPGDVHAMLLQLANESIDVEEYARRAEGILREEFGAESLRTRLRQCLGANE